MGTKLHGSAVARSTGVGTPRLPGRGQAGELAELYRVHISLVRARCRRLLGDEHAAEDAAHETFVRVARRSGASAPYDDARSWILRIATNLCLNELRAQRTRARYLDDLRHVWPPSLDGNPRLLARDAFERILLSVPGDKVRTVALLRYVDGYHDGEIAERLGVSRRTVVYRLSEFHRTAVGVLHGRPRARA